MSLPDDPKVRFALRYFRRLRRVEKYVLANLHRRFNLSDVASAVGMSPSRLSHLFREKTGWRFSDWVRAQRLGRAQELLARSDISILEVSQAAGFGNVRTLERAFQRLLQLTPSEYRTETISRHSR